jgi:hypothetical protein
MNELNQVSNFLEYYDVFLELASIYSNRIQIALNHIILYYVKLEQDPKGESKNFSILQYMGSSWERSVRKYYIDLFKLGCINSRLWFFHG